MAKILVEIKNCSQCPYVRLEGVTTPDTFEVCQSWHCEKKDKQIRGCVDTFDKVEIPEWCPVLVRLNDGT